MRISTPTRSVHGFDVERLKKIEKYDISAETLSIRWIDDFPKF